MDMDRELKANEHKGDWDSWSRTASQSELISEFEWHKAKLLLAIKDGNKNLVREYLAAGKEFTFQNIGYDEGEICITRMVLIEKHQIFK